jgi:hypothetical protein
LQGNTDCRFWPVALEPAALRHGVSWMRQRWPVCIAPIFSTKAFRAEWWRLRMMARFAKKSSD